MASLMSASTTAAFFMMLVVLAVAIVALVKAYTIPTGCKKLYTDALLIQQNTGVAPQSLTGIGFTGVNYIVLNTFALQNPPFVCDPCNPCAPCAPSSCAPCHKLCFTGVDADLDANTGILALTSGAFDLAYQLNLTSITGIRAQSYLTKNGEVVDGSVVLGAFTGMASSSFVSVCAKSVPVVKGDVLALKVDVQFGSEVTTVADAISGSHAAASLVVNRSA
jgi:hypothetical protein